MSSLNSIREHDGIVLELEATVNAQLAAGVRRLVAEAVPVKPSDSTSPPKDEGPLEGEGLAVKPPLAEPQEPHIGSEAAGEQASASSEGQRADPAGTEAVKKEDEGARKPLLSDDCCTCYACNISVPYKEMMGQHMMSDWHAQKVRRDPDLWTPWQYRTFPFPKP